MPDPISPTAASHHRRPIVQPAPRRSRLLLTGVPVLAVFTVFGAVVWLAYEDGTQGAPVGEPPLIKAEATPIKLPASDAEANDVVVADQGSVGRLWEDAGPEGGTERLLPLPEEPRSPDDADEAVAELPVAATPDTAEAPLEFAGDDTAAASGEAAPGSPESSPAPVSPDAETATADAAAETAAAETTAAEVASEDAAPADAATQPSPSSRETAEAALDRLLAEVANAANLPEDEPAVTPPGEDTAGAPEEVTAALESPADSEPATSPSLPTATSEPATAPPATPLQPATTEPAPQTEPGTPEEPEVRPAIAAAPAQARPGRQPTGQNERPADPPATAPDLTPRVAAAVDGDYRIQLAAVRAEADAQRAWDLFQVDLGPVLSDLEPFFERAETANGVFYRVQVGPLASQQDAETLCEQLKQLNASCFVVRR